MFYLYTKIYYFNCLPFVSFFAHYSLRSKSMLINLKCVRLFALVHHFTVLYQLMCMYVNQTLELKCTVRSLLYYVKTFDSKFLHKFYSGCITQNVLFILIKLIFYPLNHKCFLKLLRNNLTFKCSTENVHLSDTNDRSRIRKQPTVQFEIHILTVNYCSHVYASILITNHFRCTFS